jgi:hypothetical protein
MRIDIMLYCVKGYVQNINRSYRAQPRYPSLVPAFKVSRLRSTRTGLGALILLQVAGMLASSGCATTAQTKTDGTNVALGQTATVDGPRIRPIAVLEDSRCPINAHCVWAGRVRVKILWVRPSGNEELELIMGEAKPMADGAITLIAVTPYKILSKDIKLGDYRFSFAFAGGL